MTRSTSCLWCAAALLLVVGCRGEEPADPPEPAPIAAVPGLTADEKIILALDYYEPMYKVDASGRVTRLRLPWRNLPPPVIAEIGKLTELQGMDVAGSTLTDDGLAQLKGLQKLRSLGIGNTLVTEKGLTHLAKLEALQHVWVSKKTISKEAVDQLRELRPDLNVHVN